MLGEVGGAGGVPGGEGGRDVPPGPGRGHRGRGDPPHIRPGPLEGGGAGARPLRTRGLILTSGPGGGDLEDTRRGQGLEPGPESLVTPEHEELEAVHLDRGLGELYDGVGVDAIDAARWVFVLPDGLTRLLDLDSAEDGEWLTWRGLFWPLRALERRQRGSGGLR